MDKILATLSTYLSQAHDVIVKYGPNVWDATLQLIRFKSVWTLVCCGTALLAVLVFIKLVWLKLYRSCLEENDGRWVPFVFGSVALLVGITVIIVNLSSFDTWLGAISPQLYILYNVAQKAGIL